MTDRTFRSREEIEEDRNEGFDSPLRHQQLSLEVLLDIRDLLQRPHNCDHEVNSAPHEEPKERERDELFDEAKRHVQHNLGRDQIVTPNTLRVAFEVHGLTYARASDLMDALEAEGVIKKDGPGKPYRVV